MNHWVYFLVNCPSKAYLWVTEAAFSTLSLWVHAAHIFDSKIHVQSQIIKLATNYYIRALKNVTKKKSNFLFACFFVSKDIDKISTFPFYKLKKKEKNKGNTKKKIAPRLSSLLFFVAFTICDRIKLICYSNVIEYALINKQTKS